MSATASDYKAQTWMHGRGTLSGNSALVKKNASLLPFDGREAPYLILLTLIYRELGGDGLPIDAEELTRLDQTEERVADAMQAHYKAHFALSVTSAGTRDLFFFHADATTDTAADALVKLIEPTVDYELSLIHDPAWRPYREILPEAVPATEA